MAKTIYVSKTGNDSNSGLTLALAKLTLNGANAIAVTGDTVEIGEGTWTEDEEIGKVDLCTYNGSGMFRTYINGSITDDRYAKHILKNMYIHSVGTTVTYRGYIPTAEYVFFDFSDNDSFSNSICYAYDIDVNWVGCVFYGYSGNAQGIFGRGNSSKEMNISNCTFANMDQFYPFSYDADPNTTWYFRNCIFYYCGNSSYFGYGGPDQHLTINNDFCCFYNTPLNMNGSYVVEGDNNISEDPKFVDAGSGNFILADDSPLIGQGTAIL